MERMTIHLIFGLTKKTLYKNESSPHNLQEQKATAFIFALDLVNSDGHQCFFHTYVFVHTLWFTSLTD